MYWLLALVLMSSTILELPRDLVSRAACVGLEQLLFELEPLDIALQSLDILASLSTYLALERPLLEKDDPNMSFQTIGSSGTFLHTSHLNGHS
jgi:hypothetical protein